MRTFLPIFFAFACFAGTASAQPKDCRQCLRWSADRPLAWGDFKGRSSSTSPNKAMTDSGIAIAFQCEDGRADVKVSCYFNPAKSWTRTGDSKRLLAHEQLHFDITELFARKLRKTIVELGTDCETLNREIGGLYDRNFEVYAEFQARYDRETHHSTIEPEQLRWEQLVAEELKALEAFQQK